MYPQFELRAFSEWLMQPQNSEGADLFLASSIASAAERRGLQIDEVLDLLGEEDRMDFVLMHFDNCAASSAPEGVTSLGQIYLKKRGWKETALNRAYIEALCASRFQLLKVVEISDTQWTVVSALTESQPLRVAAPPDYHLEPGYLLATRVITVRGKIRFASGQFAFPGEFLDDIVEHLKDARARAVDAIEARGDDIVLPEALDEFLALSPFKMIDYWLEDALAFPDDEAVEQIVQAFDGDYWRSVYSLADGIDEAQFSAAVSSLPDLVAANPGRWRLADVDAHSGDQELSRIQHAIVFSDRRLKLYAASEPLRDRLSNLFAALDETFFAGPILSDEVPGIEMGKDLVMHLSRQFPP